MTRTQSSTGRARSRGVPLRLPLRRSIGRSVRRSAGVVGLVAGLVLGGTSVPGAAAAEQITRSPWQMHTEPTPHALVTPGGTHGDQSAYTLASIPSVDDSGWTPAPDGDVIKFDGTIGGIGGVSRLSGCHTQVDYTYFQTLVTVPIGGTVDTFTVNFNGIDDGARITIFNPANPAGVVVPGSYVTLGGSGTTDLAAYVGQGVNRVVITQLDDCAVGNTLREASIVLNGTVVAVNRLTVLGATTVTSPWGAPVTAPVASVTSTDPSIASMDLSASVDWGDGGPATAGTLSGPAGGPFTVTGTHTYAQAGSYTIVTKVDHPAQAVDTGTASTPADILRRPLTVTAGDVSRPYGAPNPEVPASYAGFFGTDTAAVLTTGATCTSAATATSPPGTYTTTCAGAIDENYAFTYLPGTLMVLKAATALTQSPVSVLGSLLGLKITYSAVLTNKATGAGIAGETVRLSAGGPLGSAIGACTAKTDSAGRATCSGLVLGLVPALLGFSTVASYGGSALYLGSTDSTAIKIGN